MVANVVVKLITSEPDSLFALRSKADIEYAVGGGGIYSTVADYVLLLQHLLSHYTAPSTTSSSLVGSQLSSLFQPSLAASARKNLTATFGEWYEAKEDGELDWTTGMCLYNKTERRGGWSRRQGSVGWMGAASTEYFIDPKSGIAVSKSTIYIVCGSR